MAMKELTTISKEFKAIANAYAFADSKLVHLAICGKNKRIRKKNAIRAFWQGYSNYLKRGG